MQSLHYGRGIHLGTAIVIEGAALVSDHHGLNEMLAEIDRASK